jgi:hypothetical protein
VAKKLGAEGRGSKPASAGSDGTKASRLWRLTALRFFERLNGFMALSGLSQNMNFAGVKALVDDVGVAT